MKNRPRNGIGGRRPGSRPVRPRNRQGFSLVELIVVIVILSLLAVGVYGCWITATSHAFNNRATQKAFNQIQAKVEELRGVPFYRLAARPDDNLAYINVFAALEDDAFDAAEDILQEQTLVLNDNDTVDTSDDLPGTMRVFLEDVDDAYDGLDGDDANDAPADYKKATIEVNWTHRGRVRQATCTTYFAGDTGYDIEELPPPADEGD